MPSKKGFAGGGFRVRVGVEGVAGELGEVRDVGQGDGPGPAGDAVPDPELGQRLAERVHPVLDARAAGHPATGDGAEHLGAGLHRRALHVVLHASDAAHLLATAGPTRAAVHERRQR